METIKINDVFKEDDLHSFLKNKGFVTNHDKHEKENGVDVIAIKNGKSYLIEHKRLEKRENGTYRFSGEIKGDICIVSTPKGNTFFLMCDETSLTKTARFIDEIF